MIRNHLKFAFRRLLKERGASVINTLGLTIGLALTILVFLFIGHEYNYDRWLPGSEAIHRMLRVFPSGKASSIVPSPVAAAAMQELPGVEGATRLSGFGEALVSVEGESAYWQGVGMADSLFFRVLQWPLLAGDPHSALTRPNSVVLSEKAAQQLFGTADPMGRTLRIDDETDLTVTGVMAVAGGLSHLADMHFLIARNDFSNYWTGAHCQVFLRLQGATAPEVTAERLTQLAIRHIRQEYLDEGDAPPSSYPDWQLQPISDIHLHSSEIGGYQGEHPGDFRNLGILLLLTLVVLLVAVINYINLATARATHRAREVGIRKTVGASRTQIRQQFLTDSLLQSFLALLAGFLLADLTLPYFREIVDRDLQMADALQPGFILGALLLGVLTGLLAGGYPAFLLSRFKPHFNLQNGQPSLAGGLHLRQGLVIIQFGLSITMLVLVTFIWRQVNFMLEKEVGFEAGQVIMGRLNTPDGTDRFRQSRRQLLDMPAVESAALVYRNLGTSLSNYQMTIEGEQGNQSVNILFTDAGLAETLQLELVTGRFFDRRINTDTAGAFVVNEAFVEAYGLENPLGHSLKFVFDEQYGEIIGVVKDFHYQGLHRRLEPLILSARQDLAWYSGVTVRLSAGRLQEGLQQVESFWSRLEPAHPFRYTFLDESFARNYESYTRFGKIILGSAILSILIAALGLFGLASFTTEKRTKEIGIRKVFGASVGQLIRLLAGEFVRLVLVAGLIALPVGYLLVRKWLSGFAYPVAVGVMPFLLAVAAALMVAFLTISIRVYRASTANPVKALRNE